MQFKKNAWKNAIQKKHVEKCTSKKTREKWLQRFTISQPDFAGV